jgi:hypothetical protein
MVLPWEWRWHIVLMQLGTLGPLEPFLMRGFFAHAHEHVQKKNLLFRLKNFTQLHTSA